MPIYVCIDRTLWTAVAPLAAALPMTAALSAKCKNARTFCRTRGTLFAGCKSPPSGSSLQRKRDMETPLPWCVGDRVQTTRPMASLPCGSTGTIRQVFPAGDFCDVRFDGKLLPRLVHCSVLERLPSLERIVGTAMS